MNNNLFYLPFFVLYAGAMEISTEVKERGIICVRSSDGALSPTQLVAPTFVAACVHSYTVSGKFKEAERAIRMSCLEDLEKPYQIVGVEGMITLFEFIERKKNAYPNDGWQRLLDALREMLKKTE